MRFWPTVLNLLLARAERIYTLILNQESINIFMDIHYNLGVVTLSSLLDSNIYSDIS